MSVNSAQLLVNFFDEETADRRQKYKIEVLLNAVADVRAHLPVWAAQGTDVKAFEQVLVVAAREIVVQSNNSGTISGNVHQQIKSGDIGVLRWAASLLNDETPAVTEAQRESLHNMMANARGALRDDETLPPDLRAHLATLLLYAEGVLDDYEFRGDFVLAETIERLMGAFRIAENVTKTTPNVWTTFYSDWVQPVATALLGSAPGTALAITALLTTPPA